MPVVRTPLEEADHSESLADRISARIVERGSPATDQESEEMRRLRDRARLLRRDNRL